MWHIADDVSAALKVRYGLGSFGATHLAKCLVSAHPRHLDVSRRRTALLTSRPFAAVVANGSCFGSRWTEALPTLPALVQGVDCRARGG
jgi:hypothetical protein